MDASAEETVSTPDASDQPVIGIGAHAGPVKTEFSHTQAIFAPQLIVDRVAAAGCTPVLLPPAPGIEHTIGRLDGLVLIGGPDIDPALYSAARHPKTVLVNPRRDAAELAILNVALDTGVPTLGICRGLHLLNVLRKGTLYQHLPEVTGHNRHAPDLKNRDDRRPQQIRLAPDSRLARILGRDTTTVTCFHHQAVDQLGPSLAATGWSDDGVVESIELPGHPFAIAVQWHPEESEDENLFLALAEAARHASARERRQGRS